MPHTNPRDILRDIRMGRVQAGEVSFQGVPFSESEIAKTLNSLEETMRHGGRKGEAAGRRLLALAKLAKAGEGAGSGSTLLVHPSGGLISSGDAETSMGRRLLAQAKMAKASEGSEATRTFFGTPRGTVESSAENTMGQGRRILAQSKLAKAAEGSVGQGVHMMTRMGKALPVDEAAEALLKGGKKADALTELILQNADEVAESAKGQVLTRTGIRHKTAEAARAVAAAADDVGAPAARSFAREAAEMGVGTVAGAGVSKVVEKGATAAKAALGAGEEVAEKAAKKGLLGRMTAGGAGRFLLTRALPAVGIAGAVGYLLSKLYEKKVGAPLEAKVSGAQAGESIASGIMGQTREMLDAEMEAAQTRGFASYATALQRGMGEAAAQRDFDVGKVLAANQGALAAASVLSRPSYSEMLAMMEGVR